MTWEADGNSLPKTTSKVKSSTHSAKISTTITPWRFDSRRATLDTDGPKKDRKPPNVPTEPRSTSIVRWRRCALSYVTWTNKIKKVTYTWPSAVCSTVTLKSQIKLWEFCCVAANTRWWTLRVRCCGRVRMMMSSSLCWFNVFFFYYDMRWRLMTTCFIFILYLFYMLQKALLFIIKH